MLDVVICGDLCDDRARSALKGWMSLAVPVIHYAVVILLLKDLCCIRSLASQAAPRDHVVLLRTSTDHVSGPIQTASNGETVGKNQVNSLYIYT